MFLFAVLLAGHHSQSSGHSWNRRGQSSGYRSSSHGQSRSSSWRGYASDSQKRSDRSEYEATMHERQSGWARASDSPENERCGAQDSHNKSEPSSSRNFLDSHDKQDQGSVSSSYEYRRSTAQELIDLWSNYKWDHSSSGLSGSSRRPASPERGPPPPPRPERPAPSRTSTAPTGPSSAAPAGPSTASAFLEPATGQSTGQSTGQQSTAQPTEQPTAPSTEQSTGQSGHSTGQSIGQSNFLEPEVDTDTTKTKTVADDTAGASDKAKKSNKAHD